jgi:hypothetical protein
VIYCPLGTYAFPYVAQPKEPKTAIPEPPQR